MLAVIDTSVFISGLISKSGSPRLVIQAMSDKLFIPVISEETLKELAEVVVRPKFHKIINKDEATELIENLHTNALIFSPSLKLPSITQDPDDDCFIELALAARANCVVSVDPHLLTLRIFRKIPIIRPKEFFIRLKSK